MGTDPSLYHRLVVEKQLSSRGPSPRQVKLANGLNWRKVLIIEHDAGTLETIRVLLGSLEYQCVFAYDEQQALAVLDQEKPGIAILDLQGQSFSRLLLRMQGRVIVVADGDPGPVLPRRAGLWSLPRIQRDRLVHELASTLEALLWPAAALARITLGARLIFDSFRQPLPVGVRMSQPTERRLVYECGGFSIDASFDLKRDPPLIQLVGQILDVANPDHCLAGIQVVVRGRKGPIAGTLTNEFGEFQVDFDIEPDVTVELETRKNHWVTLASPSPERATRALGASS